MSGETTWRLVPASETPAMVEAAHCHHALPTWHEDHRVSIHRAMLAAAPKPPAGLYAVSEDGTARRVEVDVVGALRALYEEKARYIRLNELGDVHGTQSMRMARAALRALTGEER